MMAFSIRKEQGPAFALELTRLSVLVADMEAIGRGLTRKNSSGARRRFSIGGSLAVSWSPV
jgi:hypothetical protein